MALYPVPPSYPSILNKIEKENKERVPKMLEQRFSQQCEMGGNGGTGGTA